MSQVGDLGCECVGGCREEKGQEQVGSVRQIQAAVILEPAVIP